MKNIYSLFLSAVLTFSTLAGFSQSQTTPVNCPYPAGNNTSCNQTNWATPYLTTLSGTRVYAGQLQPNTAYRLVLEALQPVAPCASLITVVLGDGFINDETGQPFDGGFGRDVPNGQNFPGYPYKIYLTIRTNSGSEFVPQMYFKYRIECSGTTGPRIKSAQKQALLPE